MTFRQRRLQFVVRDEPAFVEIDQQHLARLQPPFLDDVGFRDRQHAHLGGHHDAVVAREQIARRPQAVAVERRADLAAVGESDGRGAIPRLHQRGVVFVESASLLVHQRIARPRLRNHHHHGMRERVAALRQEFERVVEAGGVGLALIGNRPQLVDVLAEQRRRDRGLARGHPVVVAAQRVDLAVMRDVAVGMRQRPSREGVGREALVHQRERALEIRVVQVGIILAELIGQEHALVDHRAAGDRHRVIVTDAPFALVVDRARDRLAQHVEPALELAFGKLLLALADEHLLVLGLGRLHRFAERSVVVRHVAPADKSQPLALDHLGIGIADDLPPVRLARHEQLPDGVVARVRQLEVGLGCLAEKKLVRDLHQYAGAVAHARIGAHRAAVFEIAEDLQPVLDDLVRLAAFDVGDEADAAGILVERGVVQALRLRRAGIGGRRAQQRGRVGMRCTPAFDRSCAALLLAHRILPRRHRNLRRTRRVRRPDRRRGQRATDLEKGSLARLIAAVAAPVGRHRRQPHPQKARTVPPAIRTALLS